MSYLRKMKLWDIKLKKNDECETPEVMLDRILDHLDSNKIVIWEPFVGTGRSTRYMQSRGFQVVNGDHPDFFEMSLPIVPEDKILMLVSNPPYSIKHLVIEHLEKLDPLGQMPIALLVPINVIISRYFTFYVNTTSPPRKSSLVLLKRVGFYQQVEKEDGTIVMEQTSTVPNFEIVWLCIDRPQGDLFPFHIDYIPLSKFRKRKPAPSN